MQVNQKFQLKAPIRSQAAVQAKKEEATATPTESFTKGEAPSELPSKPVFAKEAPEPTKLTGNPEAEGLSGWQRALTAGMVGVLAVGALAGCVPDSGTGTSTGAQTEEMKALHGQLDALTKSMKENGDQSNGEIAGGFINSIAEYSKATGEKGEELVETMRGAIRKHPYLAASLAFAGGTAIGIGADQLGVTDSAIETASDVVNWVKENPAKSIGIGLLVGGASYLAYQNLVKPMLEVPEKPSGERAEAMEATFIELEQKLKENPNDKEVQAEVAKTLTGRIAEYAKATGRSAVEVKNDVVAWAYDHPILATSMVAGAGVATGVVLSQAGVPETVAQLAGTAIDQAGGGFDAVVEYAKENPVVAGAVTAAVAAGAGYLIYQAMN